MNFTIKSAEALPIRGNLEVPRGARALAVLIHGFKGFKDWGFFPWLAEVLCDEAVAVCRFNMSRSEDTYSGQLDDLEKVVSYCQTHVALPIFLVGYSRGGGVALLGAADVPNLRGVVTWSAISHVDGWDELDDVERRRFDITGAASRLEVPLLIVHGARDESVPVGESAEIAAAAPDASRMIISNASHTYNAVHPLVHVPRELMLAADVTARFICAYS